MPVSGPTSGWLVWRDCRSGSRLAAPSTTSGKSLRGWVVASPVWVSGRDHPGAQPPKNLTLLLFSCSITGGSAPLDCNSTTGQCSDIFFFGQTIVLFPKIALSVELDFDQCYGCSLSEAQFVRSAAKETGHLVRKITSWVLASILFMERIVIIS